MSNKIRNKNFLKEMQIKAQKVKDAMQNRTEVLKNLSEEAKQKLADLSVNAYMEKLGINQQITRENVAKASNKVAKIIAEKQCNLTQMQVDITNGMYRDIATQLKSGMTREEVFDFYWSLPEFRTAWDKLQFNEENLRAILRTV